jgi:hypothetical protein
MVLVEHDAGLDPAQQPRQCGLAIEQRPTAQVGSGDHVGRDRDTRQHRRSDDPAMRPDLAVAPTSGRRNL